MDGIAREHAYTVARGVRALALVGNCASDPFTMRLALEGLEAAAEGGAMPFVLDRGDGSAECGYAGAPWVHDLYRWAVQQADDTVPRDQRHRIIGLLLGYSVEAVSKFEASKPFPVVTYPSTSASVG